MFNQCTPGFAGQFPVNGFNAFGSYGNQPFGFGGFQPNAYANGFQPFNWNGYAPFNGFNPFNGYAGNNVQNWYGQYWNQNTPLNGFQGFDWNTFYAGCSFGFQNACNWFNANAQNYAGQNSTPNTTNAPANFGPFGFFPYGPFPFNFYTQQNGGIPNQQAA